MIKKTDTILDDIVQQVKDHLNEKKKSISIDQIISLVNRDSRTVVSLSERIMQKPSFDSQVAKIGLIAEIKRASPSKGVFDEHFDASEVADVYAANSVSGISILTEPDYFLGSLSDLKLCYKTLLANYKNDRPAILRKDFIIDSFQVYESFINGADAFLLISKILDKNQMIELMNLGKELGIEALIEVHNRQELLQALDIGAQLIGINNRNLDDFSENLELTVELSTELPNDIVVISESGIRTIADVRKLLDHNVDGILVGEAFMSGGFDQNKVSKKIRSFMMVE